MASKSLKQRLEDVTTGSVLDHIKTVVFVYVVLTRLVKVERHLRARGIATTFLEFWTWLNKVHTILALTRLQLNIPPRTSCCSH